MNNLKLATAACLATVLFASCQNSTQEEKTTTKDSTTTVTVTVPRPAIMLSDVGTSPDFPNASLTIKKVAAKAQGDSSMVTFDFNVKNYDLKNQTSDTGSKQCNNSAMGQHIHFIMDNKPYKALYEPTNAITLPNNTEHYLMAFLSRSYHESLKNKDASVVLHFKIDEKGAYKKLENSTTPMVFYSRPKGDYIGKDTANVLLDFYVVNCTLAPDGYKVTAKISNDNHPGQDTTITLTEWKARFIHNLGTGKSHVTLTLVDKDGKQVDGPQTTVTRDFTLAAGEPMK